MKRWIASSICLLGCLAPTALSAQGLDAGISGIGLVSAQPVDGTYSGVYLDSDIATVRGGFGLGASVITPSGFVIAAEFTRADLNGEASGRLINGSGADQGRVRSVRLNSSLVAGLLGYGFARGRTRVLLLVGGGAALYPISLDDEPNELDPALIATGGVDVIHALRSRVALIATGRYGFVNRDFLIGSHVFRIGAGLRLRLN